MTATITRPTIGQPVQVGGIDGTVVGFVTRHTPAVDAWVIAPDADRGPDGRYLTFQHHHLPARDEHVLLVRVGGEVLAVTDTIDQED